MKLYIEPKMWGRNTEEEKLMELSPKFLETFIKDAKVFEIINFDLQVIADLVCEFSSNEQCILAMMNRYNLTKDQARLAMEIPMCEIPLYLCEEEYHRQIERLKKLLQIVQEINDIQN